MTNIIGVGLLVAALASLGAAVWFARGHAVFRSRSDPHDELNKRLTIVLTMGSIAVGLAATGIVLLWASDNSDDHVVPTTTSLDTEDVSGEPTTTEEHGSESRPDDPEQDRTTTTVAGAQPLIGLPGIPDPVSDVVVSERPRPIAAVWQLDGAGCKGAQYTTSVTVPQPYTQLTVTWAMTDDTPQAANVSVTLDSPETNETTTFVLGSVERSRTETLRPVAGVIDISFEVLSALPSSTCGEVPIRVAIFDTLFQ